MASGKSTVGPRLADALRYAFLDLDDAIEARAGCSIPDLFAREGEGAFRALEREALRETARRERVVVALGGGALTREDNLRWARAHGTIVYLRVPASVLVRRLQAGRPERPLLLDEAGTPLADADLRHRVQSMLDERSPYYEQADLVVDGSPSVRVVTRAILDALTRQENG
jgi:shikimate kinase